MISQLEERGEFSEEETAYLLKGDFEKVDIAISRKLEAAGLDLSLFPRNLTATIGNDLR
jgi:hypothetical protein